MANPQVEDGHTDIANEIMEAIAKTHLSPHESQIIHALWRKTYGWHKKADHISFSQWQELTGMDRRHVARTLKRLITRQIIARTGNGWHIEYAFQKDYSLWQNIAQTGNEQKRTLPEQATTRERCQFGTPSLPEQATKTLPEQAPTKEKKETIQKKKGMHHPRGGGVEVTSDPRVVEVLIEIEKRRGHRSSAYAKEGAAIKAMLKVHTPENILACWEALDKDPFFHKQGCQMTHVLQRIDVWVKDGCRPDYFTRKEGVGGNRGYSQERVASHYSDPRDYGFKGGEDE